VSDWVVDRFSVLEPEVFPMYLKFTSRTICQSPSELEDYSHTRRPSSLRLVDAVRVQGVRGVHDFDFYQIITLCGCVGIIEELMISEQRKLRK
jgi:hypothetical protein